MNMKKIFLIAGIAFLVVATSKIAFAYELTVPFPGGPKQISSPAEYIQSVYLFGLGAGALLAMLMIVIGAIQYTVSEVIPAKEAARSRIIGAIWGLVLLLIATLILFTINPKLPDLENPPGIKTILQK